MQDFRNLWVWQKSHKLTLQTYAVSSTIKQPAYYTLRDQLTRAAISIPANLAEGCGRTGDRDLRRFVRSRWDRPANLSIICFLRGIWGFCPRRCTSSWHPRWSKSSACSAALPRVCRNKSRDLKAIDTHLIADS